MTFYLIIRTYYYFGGWSPIMIMKNQPISWYQSGSSIDASQCVVYCMFLFQMLTLTVFCICFWHDFSFACVIFQLSQISLRVVCGFKSPQTVSCSWSTRAQAQRAMQPTWSCAMDPVAFITEDDEALRHITAAQPCWLSSQRHFCVNTAQAGVKNWNDFYNASKTKDKQ